jgi:hypothetical protein
VLVLLPEELPAFDHVLAGAGERAGDRREHADADGALLRVRERRSGKGSGERGDGQIEFHISSSGRHDSEL